MLSVGIKDSTYGDHNTCPWGLLLGSVINSFLGIPGLVASSAFGAFLPDMDMFFEHRKTLHRPFQFSFLAAVLSVISVVLGDYFMLLSVLLLSSAVHSFTDILCKGKTMSPWKVQDDRAVYDHLRGQWIRHMRFFYDDSRVDLGLSLLIASAMTLMYGVSYWVTGIAFLSVVYTLRSRKIDSKLSKYEKFSGFAKDII